MKSLEWLKMTPEEKFYRRQEVLLMLDAIGPELEQFNSGAAEAAFNASRRLVEVNSSLIPVLIRRELQQRVQAIRHESTATS